MESDKLLQRFQVPKATDGSIYTNNRTANFIFKNFMRTATIFPITGLR